MIRDLTVIVVAIGISVGLSCLYGSPSWRDDSHAQLNACESRWTACEHKLTETAAYRDKLVAYCRPSAEVQP